MFPKLSTLDFSKNRIKHLKYPSFKYLNELNILNFEYNEIYFIGLKVFDNLYKLNNLNLANNQIAQLNLRWFRYLGTLNTITLAKNKIQTVENSVYGWSESLNYVFLNDNRLRMLPNIPESAEVFNISGNPIYCGCKSKSFNLGHISNYTMCAVFMRCQGGFNISLNGKCENATRQGKVYRFLQQLSQGKECKAPEIKTMSLTTDKQGAQIITCVASGVPTPNVTIVNNKNKQQLSVNGIENVNTTSVTLTQIFSGTYHCKASNIVDEIKRSLDVEITPYVEQNEVFSTYSLETTHEMFNRTGQTTSSSYERTLSNIIVRTDPPHNKASM